MINSSLGIFLEILEKVRQRWSVWFGTLESVWFGTLEIDGLLWILEIRPSCLPFPICPSRSLFEDGE